MTIFESFQRVLCLSPHPDDIELGAGALLHRFRDRYNVRLVVFGDRHKSRGESNNDAEQRAAAACIGIAAENVKFVDELGLGIERLPPRLMATEERRDEIRKIVENQVCEFDPDLLLIPPLTDTMQDHQAIAEEVVRVQRGRAAIFGYEGPKHNRNAAPNSYVAVSDEDLAAKVKAVDCFAEFSDRTYLNGDAIEALARVRALQGGFGGLAEAFEVYRLIG